MVNIPLPKINMSPRKGSISKVAFHLPTIDFSRDTLVFVGLQPAINTYRTQMTHLLNDLTHQISSNGQMEGQSPKKEVVRWVLGIRFFFPHLHPQVHFHLDQANFSGGRGVGGPQWQSYHAAMQQP